MADTANYDFVKIQGIPPVNGKPGIRKEFTAFATDKPDENIQLSLFIRGLNRWYTKPYTDRLSYFQVASIHGYPGGLRWDNSDPPPYDRNKLGHYIYCTHNLITFPTWHRPYMALFEQTLWQIMGEVIDSELKFSSDTEKKAWIEAKDSWRLPYWDWALPHYKGEVPEQFKPQEINIRAPANADGSLPAPDQVTNPLFRYQVQVGGKPTKMGDLPAPYTIADVNDAHSGKPEDTYPWSKCSGTSRYGITNWNPSDDESAGKNNTAGIAKAINSHQYYGLDDPTNPSGNPVDEISKLAVSDLVYRMLLGDPNPTWDSFSSTITGQPGKNPKWKEWISLEYIHNNLHVFIGGGDGWAQGIGHMMNVPVAAFDPIFYMHHCNIDQYMAVWQTIYEDKIWFTDTDSPSAKDKLIPFHHDFGGTRGVDYFNSNDVQKWTTLGYQYDVLERHEGEGDQAYVQRIKDHVTAAYPHTGDVILRDRHKLFSSPGKPLGGGAAFANQPVDDYLVNVIYDRYGHNGGAPYTIHFFLGAAPLQAEINALGEFTAAGGVPAPKGIAELPRHVGSVFTFSSPMAPAEETEGPESKTICANCRKQHDEGVLSRATVPLTIPLYHDAANRDVKEIDSPFDGDAVKGYLADNLSWIAVNTRGTIIPWSELGNTKVYVLKGKGKHNYSARDGFDGITSKYSHYEPLPEVTRGKAAGASHEEYGQMVTGSA